MATIIRSKIGRRSGSIAKTRLRVPLYSVELEIVGRQLRSREASGDIDVVILSMRQTVNR
jgi:hypothetical protein